MKVFFDTSVIVSALVDQLPCHEAAFECYRAFTRAPHTAITTTHALAEIYATLTALPLRQRILPGEAKQLIEKSVRPKLRVVALAASDYTKALGEKADVAKRRWRSKC